MSVVVSTNGFTGSSWRRAFADALIRLRPGLNPDTADELSDSAYLRLAALDPGHAAALYGAGGDALALRSREEARQHSGA